MNTSEICFWFPVSGSSSTGVGVNVLLGTPDIDQLTQANMSLIAGYGENFMDIVCRDACDGHHVCRVSFVTTARERCRYLHTTCTILPLRTHARHWGT